MKTMTKTKTKRIKVRTYAPDFSTHTRKMPTFTEKKRKSENKHKNPMIKY